MYRVRIHGRGGQGIKTAGRILGTAFFLEGFETQDAPVYGAERRGAPMFSSVRAARLPIQERALVTRPDLVVVADESLIPVPAANVLLGTVARTVLFLNSAEAPESWRQRLKLPGPVVTLQAKPGASAGAGAWCAGAAARLTGVIGRGSLAQAIREELGELGAAALEQGMAHALEAFERLEPHAGAVAEGEAIAADGYAAPDWIELPFEAARVSAPDIHAAASSVLAHTGAWRTTRPVIDQEHCNRCNWICGTLCPDSAIGVDAAGAPRIDYDHCKGCMICVAVCPPHAIRAVPERVAGQAAVS